MIVIGIETSCDETAVAIVDSNKKILSHIISSQIDNHQPFGGVVPEISARNHLDCLDELVKTAIKQADINFNEIDGFAATAGPGLIGGVLIGTMFAKGLAFANNKPFIAVNHLEGHALTIRLIEPVEFPYLLLLVSGGHCQILEVKGVGQYSIIGKTIDDAVGEAFDKIGKMLGFNYPAGSAIEQIAKDGDFFKYQLPKPLLNQSQYDFSFSGLKTAAKRLIDAQSLIGLTDEYKADMCASVQRTIADILVNRVNNAAKYYCEKNSSHKTLIISGGVAANKYINAKIQESLKIQGFRVIAPPIKLCTDNGAMIAWAGIERLKLGLINELNFAPRSRWPLEELNKGDG